MSAHPSSQLPADLPPGLRPPTSDRTLADLLDEWLADESGEQERSWEILKKAMNETRRELGQPPVRE